MGGFIVTVLNNVARVLGDFIVAGATQVGRGFWAIDRRLVIYARKLTRFFVDGRLSWMVLAAGVVMLVAGFSVVKEIGGQLKLMHLPSVQGYGLDKVGPTNFDDAVSVWQSFHLRLVESVGEESFVSPLELARKYLLIDTIVFLPGYVLGGLAVILRGHRANSRRKTLRVLLRWAGLALVLCAVVDLLENALTSRVVSRYWGATDAHDVGPNWVDGFLGAVTIAKWVLVVSVALSLLALSLRTLEKRTRESKATITLLRSLITVGLLTIVMLALPIQLTDLFLALHLGQGIFMAVVAVLLGVSMWVSARLVLTAHERRAPKDGRLTATALLGTLVGPAALYYWNSWTGGSQVVVLIPVGLLVGLAVLGLVLRSAAPARETARLTRSLPRLAVGAPLALAAAMVAAVGLAALKALVLQWAQKGDTSLLLFLGIALTLASPLLAYVLFTFESRLVGGAVTDVGDGSERPKGLDGLVAEAITPEIATTRLRAYRLTAIACAGVVVFLATLLINDPQRATSFGAVTVVLIFFTLLALAVGALTLLADWWTNRYGLPFVFRSLRLKAIPVFSILLVWSVLAALIDDGRHWNITSWPVVDGLETSEPHKGQNLYRAFTRWADVNATPSAADGKTPVPLLIVATSGGGIRAAYWTALSLDCLLLGEKATPASEAVKNPCKPTDASTGDLSGNLFLATGISGGSLGLVEWDANRELEWKGSWVEKRLGGDFVAPSMAQGLLVEVPRSLLQFQAPGRAETLEDSWVRAWGDDDADNPMNQGFLASQEQSFEAGGPFLLLNGSSVFDGCSLNVSLLDIGSTIGQTVTGAPLALSGGDCTSVERYTGVAPEDGGVPNPADLAPGGDHAGPLPATVDLVDYLDCIEATDVSRATAALLSARFTYVSPAGRLVGCGGADSAKYIVDGGYVDTSAAESAIGVWLALEPMIQFYNSSHLDTCVVPYFVQLDNSYLPTQAPRVKHKPPNQITAPLTALFQTTGLKSRSQRARAWAAEKFTLPFPRGRGDEPRSYNNRYALIAPRGHPGVEAPLGWTLSDESRRDLERQLYDENFSAITKVRSWLENPPACPI